MVEQVIPTHASLLMYHPYHVSEVCTEGASGLLILHHTVVVQDVSTALTAKEKKAATHIVRHKAGHIYDTRISTSSHGAIYICLETAH